MISNSSPEWWSVANLDGSDELSLHQYGWAVTTVGGARYDLPPKRGSDMTVAYRPGQVHRRKIPDARTITLLMFMVGWDPATGTALGTTTGEQLVQWNDNWDTLRRAVFRNSLLTDQRIRLYRRHLLTTRELPTVRTGDFCIQGDPGVPGPGQQLIESFANADMTGQMQPTMTGRYRAEFQLDFTLSDPYFHGPGVSVTLNVGSDKFVWNDGFDVAGAGYMQVDMVGPLINPVITNYSTNPDSWVKYNGIIRLGETVRLVTNKFTAERVTTSGPFQNRIANISSYGARWWVSLLPGSNKLRLSADPASTGHVTASFRPPYL